MRYFRFLLVLLLFRALPLSAQCLIEGVVSDAGDGLPLVGVQLRVLRHDLQAVSDENGAFVLDLCGVCSEKTHELSLQYAGYEPKTIEIHLPQQSQRLRVSLRPADGQLIETAVCEVRSDFAISQSVERLSRADLDANLRGNLAESLTRIAGVDVLKTGTGIGKPVIRGLWGARVGVRLDDLRVEGQQWGGDHGLEVDALDVQAVSVVKGASALAYGGDATGGLVLVESADFAPLPRRISTELQTMYKSNNHHYGISAQLRASGERWRLQARATQQSWGDYAVNADSFSYNGYRLPLYERRLKNSAGLERSARISAAFLEHNKYFSRLTASAYWLDAGIFAGAVGVPRAYSLRPDGDLRDRLNPRQNVAHYRLQWRHTQYFPQHTAWHWYHQVAAQYNLRREFSTPETHSRPLSMEGGNNLALSLGLLTFTAEGRAEFAPLNGGSRYQFGAQANAQMQQAGGFEFLSPAYTGGQAAAYFSAEHRAKAGHIWTYGARLDYTQLHTKAHSVKAWGNAGSIVEQERAAALQRQFFNYALALGYRHALPKGQHLRLHAAKGFRAPTPNELAANGIHHGTFRHERGDSNLRSEQAYQGEIGYGLQGKNWSVDAAAFGSFFDGFLYLRPTARFSTLPEGGQVYQFSQHDVVQAGGELRYEYQSPKLPLHWSQSAQYVLLQNLETGLPLPFSPPARLLSVLDFAPNLKKKDGSPSPISLHFSLEHELNAAQNRTDRNEAPTPAYHLLHASATLRCASARLGRFAVSLQLQNAFDSPYLQHLSRYRPLLLPEQGRNLVLSFKWNWE